MSLPPLLKARTRKVQNQGDFHLLVDGRLDKDGYARFGGAAALAHRVAYEAYSGPIPEGLQVHHTCRIRNCIHKAHLEAVTREENVKARKPYMSVSDQIRAKNR
jgi:HNH endonuclease